MKIKSFQNIQTISPILFIASVITAAIVPTKSTNNLGKFVAGSLTNHSSLGNGGPISSITCAPDSNTISRACFASTVDGNSETTGINPLGSDDSTTNSSLPADGGVGQNNTTSLLGS